MQRAIQTIKSNALALLLTTVLPLWNFWLSSSLISSNVSDPMSSPFNASFLPALAIFSFYPLIIFWYHKFRETKIKSIQLTALVLSSLLQGIIIAVLVGIHLHSYRILRVLVAPAQLLFSSGSFQGFFPLTIAAWFVLSILLPPISVLGYFTIAFWKISNTNQKKIPKTVPLLLLSIIYFSLGVLLQLIILWILGFPPYEVHHVFTESCGGFFSQHACFVR